MSNCSTDDDNEDDFHDAREEQTVALDCQQRLIDGDTDWDDLLGTGTILKNIIVAGQRNNNEFDHEMIEATYQRGRFFALIDIETKSNDITIESESYENFLISSDADLFPGAHLVIPLMDINEKSRYIFDPKFGYGPLGNKPHINGDTKLDCTITLKIRSPYDDFLTQLTVGERLKLANRKKDRGKFWYSREDYQNAITIYQTMKDLCLLEIPGSVEGEDVSAGDNNNIAID